MLSDTERKVLSMAALSDKDIAKRMHYAEKSIRCILTKINKKLGTKNRTMAIFKAILSGELKVVDIGFFDANGNYKPDYQLVNLRRE